MPELPEVETSRRGIEPHIHGQTISRVIIRQPQLRWPIAKEISEQLPGQLIQNISRRGKYLLLNTAVGTAILHLGMSGSLRIVANSTPHQKHDHVDIQFTHGKCLRFNDPRRFGCLLWCAGNVADHALLSHLGPEPLTESFSAEYLFQKTRGRKKAIKQVIMDHHIVVGVGNIYASEALFMAGIRPGKASKSLTKLKVKKLVDAIKLILKAAIEQGGTTLKDFQQSDGKPGYFAQHLKVYNRAGQPCYQCQILIKDKIQGGRRSFYCQGCQK
jgi:formamidopyrimidine-DNA glycosylase